MFGVERNRIMVHDSKQLIEKVRDNRSGSSVRRVLLFVVVREGTVLVVLVRTISLSTRRLIVLSTSIANVKGYILKVSLFEGGLVKIVILDHVNCASAVVPITGRIVFLTLIC